MQIRLGFNCPKLQSRFNRTELFLFEAKNCFIAIFNVCHFMLFCHFFRGKFSFFPLKLWHCSRKIFSGRWKCLLIALHRFLRLHNFVFPEMKIWWGRKFIETCCIFSRLQIAENFSSLIKIKTSILEWPRKFLLSAKFSKSFKTFFYPFFSKKSINAFLHEDFFLFGLIAK